MALSIKNSDTEQLARKLAALTGESVTGAILTALKERYERIAVERGGKSLENRLNEIALECAALPVISNLSEDEILGYDDFGAPTR